MEAVPMVGPILAAIPAILIALPHGMTTVLLVVAFAAGLQLFENNVLIPRIMRNQVGVSSLLGLFAILAFGSLYGVLGALVAIPLTVVVQVILTHTLINPDPVSETVDPATQSVEALRTQLQGIRQQIHLRLQDRDSRMQPQPTGATVDQVADTVEQQLEQAIEQIETMLAALEQEGASIPYTEQQRAVAVLRRTVENIEHTLNEIEATIPVADKANGQRHTPIHKPVVAKLSKAVAEVERRVQDAGEVVNEVQEPQRDTTEARRARR
jgi:hypothetical protein